MREQKLQNNNGRVVEVRGMKTRRILYHSDGEGERERDRRNTQDRQRTPTTKETNV
jgi:hypothetical protein